MVGILILTHGALAHELLAAARRISGELEGFEALSLGWEDDADEVKAKVQAAVAAQLAHHDSVLVLTDIYGGTPSNAAMSLRQLDRVAVVSGVNLPMVVRLGCATPRSMAVEEMSDWIRNKGRASICASCDPVVASNGAPKPCPPE